MGSVKSCLESQQQLSKMTWDEQKSLEKEHSNTQYLKPNNNAKEDIQNQEDSEEFIKQAILKGVDNRKMVTDEQISQLPYRLIGHLHSIFQGENNLNGTGVMVAPNIVLTAAHNVYQYGVKTRICTFSLALNKGKSKYIFEVDVTKIFIPKNYSEKGADDSKNTPFDYALLVLKPNAAFQEQKLSKIDYQASRFMHLLQESVDYEANLHESAIIAGYPKQLYKDSLVIDVSGCQYAGTGSILSNKKSKMIQHLVATSYGRSGAPIVVEISGIKYIIGIHVDGNNKLNRGISVRSMKDDLNEWCRSINGNNIVDTIQNLELKLIIPSIVKITVKQMKQIPFHRMGLIISKHKGREYTTSGCLIAPYLVLTTAQAKYYQYEDTFCDNIQFILGHHKQKSLLVNILNFNEQQPENLKFEIDHVLLPKEYLKSYKGNKLNYDFALLVLRKQNSKMFKKVSQINSQPFLNLICDDDRYSKIKEVTIVWYLEQQDSRYIQNSERNQFLVKSLCRINKKSQNLQYKALGGLGMAGGPIFIRSNNQMHIIGIHKGMRYQSGQKFEESIRVGVKMSSMKNQVEIWLKYLTGMTIKMEELPRYNIRELIDNRNVELPKFIN